MIKELTKEQLELLKKPLPVEAITAHPTKKFLSSIKAIYVVERLNDVFGVWKWKVECFHETTIWQMVVVKIIFTVPEYGIVYECFGWNDNSDLWDAYKWATTDALTKIWSYLWIWMDVFKWQWPTVNDTADKSSTPASKSTPKKENPVKQDIDTGNNISEQALDCIRKFRAEYKDILNDDWLLLAIQSVSKVNSLKDLPKLTKLEWTKVIKHLMALSHAEVEKGREIKDPVLKTVVEQFMSKKK